MFDIERQSESRCRIILRPNRSLSWRGTKLFFLGMCVLLGAVGSVFTWLGFWLVLPFAGLELLLLGSGLYLVARSGDQREVISIDAESVCIEKGRRHPEQRWVMVRLWARVVLERCPRQWYPSRLLIRSHGRAVEVGRFLNEDERRRLASELVRSL